MLRDVERVVAAGAEMQGIAPELAEHDGEGLAGQALGGAWFDQHHALDIRAQGKLVPLHPQHGALALFLRMRMAILVQAVFTENDKRLLARQQGLELGEQGFVVALCGRIAADPDEGEIGDIELHGRLLQGGCRSSWPSSELWRRSPVMRSCG